MSSTSAGDKDPIESINDTGEGAKECAEEKVEISSRFSATQGTRKQPSVPITEINKMEL